MLSNRFFPYSSMQEINLDWILTKIKNILRFIPDDGAVGQILRRTAHGAEWSDEQGGGGGAVSSVNGQTGAVVLTASDVGALPDTYAAPVDSVNGQTGAVVLDAGDVGALPDTTVIPSDTSDLTNTAGFVDAAGAAAAAPVQSVNSQTGAVVLGKSDVGLGSVDNVQQYSAINPPPYPVTSVNGQTGAVVIPSISPTEYDAVSSSTSNSATVHTYTVTGSGFVIVSANMQSDSTSDTGVARAVIRKNSVNFAYDECAIDIARAYPIGASCSCAFTVQNGDVVETDTIGTKNGTKTHIVHILAFGCTLS